jgi:molecular chaperone DnaK (HSP70)
VLVFDWAAGAFGAAVVEITGEDVEVVCAGGGDLLGVRDLEQRGTAQPTAEGGLDDEPLRQAVERAVEATRGILLAAGLQPGSLDELLVTGTDRGAVAVRARLEQLMGRPPSTALDPDEAPAIGAALFGHSLVQRSQGKRGLALFEVLGAPIGVAVAGGGFHKVLEQNTRLPAEKTLAVPARGHVELSVAVYQGTSAHAPDNEYLGVLTTTAERDGDLEVRFSVSADGRLALSARSPGGQPVEAHFDSSAADPEALARHLAAATLGDPRATRPAPQGLFGGLKRFFGG